MESGTPLVIGYGNSLRCDDGAGIQLAEALQARTNLIHVMTCHQLTLDLADAIWRAKAVLFLDASAECDALHLKQIWAEEGSIASVEPLSHSLTTLRLLTFTNALYGSCPPTWEMLIPGQVWDIGEHLSAAAAAACQAALPLVMAWGSRYA